MRKIVIILSILLLGLVTAIILVDTFKNNDYEEKVYSIETSYSYLSKGNVNIPIKIYSNKDDSLLQYACEADVTLHDKGKNNIISCSVSSVYINVSTTYKEELYYEYIINIGLDITHVVIEDCYLSLEYDNTCYMFKIGSLEITENIYLELPYNISNLYGLTSDEYFKSLCGIVLTIKNDSNENINIDMIDIGSNYKVLLSNDNKTNIADSFEIKDYINKYKKFDEYYEGEITLAPNIVETYVLPILYINDYYLSNCYLLFYVGDEVYYYNNFTYINSIELDTMSFYVKNGVIYGA